MVGEAKRDREYEKMKITNNPKRFDLLKIYSGDNWDAFIHESQYYLGRTYIARKADGDKDLFDLESKELLELAYVGRKIKGAVYRLWQPDKFNITQLGNEWNHTHVHLIPRYKEPRKCYDLTFHDENWGKNPSPYPKNFVIPVRTFFMLKNIIEGSIK